MAMIPYTRAEHRTSLVQLSNQKISASDTTTLDFWINLAELEALSEFSQFHPGIQRRARQSGATDASGILLMSQGFEHIDRLEDSEKKKYPYIDSIDDVWNGTGYFFVGMDASATAVNNKYKLQVMKNGAVLASTTLYWWDILLVVMGTAATNVSAVPDGYKQCIDYLAAKKFWENQGSASQEKQAKYFSREYEALLSKARDKWQNPQTDTEWVDSVDPDAGEYGGALIHRVS
jgi:hypothetical protein